MEGYYKEIGTTEINKAWQNSRRQPNKRFQGLEAKKTDIHQRPRNDLKPLGLHTWQQEPKHWRQAGPSPTHRKERMHWPLAAPPPTAETPACSPFQNYQISKNYRSWVAYNHNCFDHIGQACISISGNYRGRGHLLHSFNSRSLSVRSATDPTRLN